MYILTKLIFFKVNIGTQDMLIGQMVENLITVSQ